LRGLDKGPHKKWADDAARRADSKAETLLKWLQQIVKPGGKWGDERVIIFTEYRATQLWLADLLASAKLAGESLTGPRLMLLYGGMPHDDRESIKAAFQAGPDLAGVRILLATDTASEGINLQNHCSRLIHYEIPWNPSRMEQRNGRVDRHGQRAAGVDIFHFVSKGFDAGKPNHEGTSENLDGDLEFLMRAVLKVETIRQDLGKVGPVIAAQVEQAVLGRTRVLDTSRAERDAQSARTMLKVDRDLRKLVQALRLQLDETRQTLLLSPANVQHAVTVALELAGQLPLNPVSVPGIPNGSAFMLPALGGPWARCAEGMEHPHTRQTPAFGF
jgi:superfamily II DNA/RNA helicase